MKNFLAIGLCVFLFVSALACSARKTMPETALKTGETQKILLRLHWQKGMKTKTTESIDQTIDQSVMGLAVKTAQKFTIEYAEEVLAVDANGVADVRYTYTGLSYRMDSPIGSLAFNSAASSNDDPLLKEIFSALIGQSFVMQLDSRGRAVSFSGVKELRDHVMKSYSAALPMSDAFGNLLTQLLDENNLAQTQDNISSLYPENAMAVGDYWEAAGTVSSFAGTEVKTNYTLHSRENGMSKISLKSQIGSTTGSKPIDMGIMQISYQLAGTQTGFAKVDEKSGRVFAMTVNQRMDGEMKTAGALGEFSVPISIVSTIATTAEIEK